MVEEDPLAQLFENGRVNAVISWAIVGLFLAVLLEGIFDGDIAWTAFTGTVLAIVLLPAISRRSPQVMLPWELLVLASFPIVVRAAEVSALSNTFATYLSIAALALIVTVEVHVLSHASVTRWFAVGFVSFATLAVAGAWAIVRWNLDAFLGTALLTTNEDLMVEFLSVLLAGGAAGILFDLYFRRRARRLRRSLGWVIRR